MCPTGTSLRPARKPADLRSAFEVLDVDHDGKISRDDLKAVYSADDDIIGTMMTVADFNKDGYVEYDEFEKVLRSDKSGSGGVMEDAFKAMDRDGDGRVGYDDLRSFLNSAGFQVNDDDIKAMIKLGSEDGEDVGVTFDGFLKILAI